MAEHKAIDRWAMKKFAADKLPEGTVFRVEEETEWEGYCDTCRYETTVVEVYAKLPDKDSKWYLHQKLNTHLAEIMTEILDASLS